MDDESIFKSKSYYFVVAVLLFVLSSRNYGIMGVNLFKFDVGQWIGYMFVGVLMSMMITYFGFKFIRFLERKKETISSSSLTSSDEESS